jgi:hypothetical protein
MATITVRRATPDDATELARLLDLFDSLGATPEQVAARILACQNVLTTFIGEMDGQPVGFACLRLVPHLQGEEPYAELTDIYRAIIIRRLRGLRSWHILGVHRHQQGFSVHLVRVPDAQSGPTPFIRDRWRIRRAVAEAWLHFRRTDAGLYEAATQGFVLHEGATPGRFLLSEMRELRRRFHVAVRRRLARLFGRVGS